MDLGTANTLIYEKGRGIVLNEPSVVALDTETREVLAVGHEAKSYLGRAPKSIEVIRPLRAGVISDFAVTRKMITTFLEMVGAKRLLFRPQLVVGVPTEITQVEKKAIIEAAESAGAKNVYLMDEPLAAAIGIGLPVQEPVGRLILDVGGGTSEGIIVSMGSIAVSVARRVAGDEATEAIARYIRRKYHIAVGINTAENIKLTIGSAMPQEEMTVFECRGKELSSGNPKMIEITDADIRQALEEINVEFIDMVKRLINQAPPELSVDLMKNGLYLTGGGSMLKGLDARLSQETGFRVQVPAEPLISVVMGLGHVMENIPDYKPVFVN